MESIYSEIIVRRKYQDKKYGGPAHDDEHTTRDWIFFVVKFLGRATTASTLEKVRGFFLDIAALAVAAIESIDRVLGS